VVVAAGALRSKIMQTVCSIVVKCSKASARPASGARIGKRALDAPAYQRELRRSPTRARAHALL
jgi:hypothetical protein